MQVDLSEYGLLITPETEFESKWLSKNFNCNNYQHKLKAFLKHGTSADELIGLKVFREEQFANNAMLTTGAAECVEHSG